MNLKHQSFRKTCELHISPSNFMSIRVPGAWPSRILAFTSKLQWSTLGIHSDFSPTSHWSSDLRITGYLSYPPSTLASPSLIPSNHGCSKNYKPLKKKQIREPKETKLLDVICNERNNNWKKKIYFFSYDINDDKKYWNSLLAKLQWNKCSHSVLLGVWIGTFWKVK